MRVMTRAELKAALDAVLDNARTETVVIEENGKTLAAVVSPEHLERARQAWALSFDETCDRIAARVEARGMTDAIAEDLLKDVS